ncbi:ArsR family transcriptional regulator [Fuchsiella alkaliacetigena]|uniref:ArsR family transcriptional regulator n=1 Tax=Fuchsiella alkaliacetigena TaxID=957042 RepID=UPI00200A87AE|nr:ArsR family transcriptional regulator [Fuchsiella alkaliacetigena]MCK8826006.1 ArsR family transcriptional regulator [Fuchsiella alkaliacetigena]
MEINDKTIENTELSQPLVSFHLKGLREANIISSQREGTFVYYSLNNSKLVRDLMLFNKHLDYFESKCLS